MTHAVFKSTTAGAAFVFLTTLAVFFFSPVRLITDSSYSMLLSENLLTHRRVELDESVLRYPPKQQVGWVSNGHIYQIEPVGGHLYYYFPPTSSVLALPFVALMNRAAGIYATKPDGSYNRDGEKRIEARLAALLMAGLCVAIFLTARLLLPLAPSLLIALGCALGTPIWSTASRGLWSDTWGIFLLGLAVLLLTGVETGRWKLRPVLLGTLAALMYLVKPTYSVAAFGISLYVLLYYRPLFVRYILTVLCWLACLVAYSEFTFHQLLPNYYRASRLTFAHFGEAFAGNLVSPSRGLLVYVPVLFFVAYLLVRYRHHLVLPRLVVLSLGVTALHLIAIAGFPLWWAGYCYGPRFCTPLVPWLALLSIVAIKAWLAEREKATTSGKPHVARWKAECTAGAMLLLTSVVLHGVGAFSYRAVAWCSHPVSIDVKPERVWDWRDPQFLRAAFPERAQ